MATDNATRNTPFAFHLLTFRSAAVLCLFAGPKVNTKRVVPDQPKAGRFIEGGKRVITLQPLAYVGLYQG